jgi:Tfp pilus assembly protein PilO
MSAMESQDRRGGQKSNLLERLHNPTELRLCVMAVMLGIGYVAVYLPFDASIAATTRKLAEARKRLTLADEVEVLRREFRTVQPRIPSNPDVSEWLQYVLSGLRQSPIRLDSFNPDPPKALGNYQLLTIKIRASGSFADLDQFIYWLESNPRLFRVDNVKMSMGDAKAAMKTGDVSADIVVVGVMG